MTTVAALATAAFVGLGTADTATAADAPNQSCSYASPGTGQYADTICWLDLGALDTDDAASAAGQNFSYNIAGKYTLSFNLKSSGNRGVRSATFPTYGAAYLGNAGNYSGVSGQPALLTTNGDLSAGDTTVTQSNITMTDSAGRAVTGWSLVGADSESTDGDGASREFDQWTSTAPIRSLTTRPDGSNGLGNACDGGFTGIGTTTVTCTGGPDPNIGDKTGAPIVASDTPTTFSQVMHTTPETNQGVAFGVLVSKLTLVKTVAGRLAPADSFETTITSPTGTTVGSATTGTANSSTTGKQTVLPLVEDGTYTFSEAASTGSTTLALYGPQWACTNAATTSTTALPSGTGTTKPVIPQAGDDITCTVTNTPAAYTVQKTSSAGQATTAGSVITYTVTVANTGPVDYTTTNPASFTDDLSNVTDDATYVAGSATNGATIDGDTLTWSGPLAAGASTTVTYQFTVNDPDTGDKVITNGVAPTGPGGACATAGGCETTSSLQSYTVQKSASASRLIPGDTITYTVTVTNTGAIAYTTGTNAASFTDDLSKVTDDATYVAGSATNGATVDGDTVTWSGPLAVGASTTVTYQFTVNDPDTGDKVLTNAVTPTGTGGTCATTTGCTTTTPVLTYTVQKAASEATLTPGATLTYTVLVTNTGQGAYTTDRPASFTDDLTKVIDDATFNSATVRSSDGSAPGTAKYAAPELTWSGPLAIGSTVTVTYTVTVNKPDTGDHILTNSVVPTGPGGGCATATGCTTDSPVKSIKFTKTANTTKVVPGATVTYTIVATNTGQVAYTTGSNAASFTDDLTNVLDDATYNGDAEATAGRTSYAAPTLSWSGPLGIGESATITYTVRVNDPDTGDKVLRNAVVSTSPGSGCVAGSADPDCTVVIPAGSYTVQKVASTSSANQGSTITYTILVKNTGKVAYTDAFPASFRDDLTKVLDDATYDRDAKATAGTTAYQQPNLTWSGPLPVGGTATVTYSVTVKTPDTGDRQVINTVDPTGPGGTCATDASCTTRTPVPPGFGVHTGGAAATAGTGTGWWIGLSGLGVAAMIGCALMFRRRFQR